MNILIIKPFCRASLFPVDKLANWEQDLLICTPSGLLMLALWGRVVFGSFTEGWGYQAFGYPSYLVSFPLFGWTTWDSQWQQLNQMNWMIGIFSVLIHETEKNSTQSKRGRFAHFWRCFDFLSTAYVRLSSLVSPFVLHLWPIDWSLMSEADFPFHVPRILCFWLDADYSRSPC